MIRDPSDGSVKDDVETQAKMAIAIEKTNENKSLLATSTSGLPLGSTRPDQIERLNKSREWLKEYRTRQQ